MVSGAVKVKGCASRFAGEKGEFLDAMAGEFINSTNRGSFYSLAATRYVQKFGYVIYGESPQLSNLSAESKVTELERRKKFLPWLRTTLGSWFRHKYGRGRTDQTTLNKILLTMKDVSQQRPSKPKVLHRYSQLHYKDRIKPSFDAFWASQGGAIPKSQRLATTQDFVQRSWAGESAEFCQAFEERIETEYQDSLAAYNRRMDYSRTTPQAKLDAWLTIDSVVPNIADTLGEWVGGCVHIDIVVPLGSDDGNIHVKSVQSRVVVPEHEEPDDPDGTTQLLFAEWDPEADLEHKARLVKYATAIFTEEERQGRIISANPDDDLAVAGALLASSIPTNSEDSEQSPPTRSKRQQATWNSFNSITLEPIPDVLDPSPLFSSTPAPPSSDDNQRVYNEDDVEATNSGLFRFQDDEMVITVAKMAVAAAGGSYNRPNTVVDPATPITVKHPTTKTKAGTATTTPPAAMTTAPAAKTRTATANMLLRMLAADTDIEPIVAHTGVTLTDPAGAQSWIPDAVGNDVPPSPQTHSSPLPTRSSPRKRSGAISFASVSPRSFVARTKASPRQDLPEEDKPGRTIPGQGDDIFSDEMLTPPRPKLRQKRKVIDEDSSDAGHSPTPPSKALQSLRDGDGDSPEKLTPLPPSKPSRKRALVEADSSDKGTPPPLPSKPSQKRTLDEEESPDEPPVTPPSKKSRRRKVAEEESPDEPPATPPSKRGRQRQVVEDDKPNAAAPAVTAKSARKRKAVEEENSEECAPAPAKRNKQSQVSEGDGQQPAEEAEQGSRRVRNKSAKLQEMEAAKEAAASSRSKKSAPRKSRRS